MGEYLDDAAVGSSTRMIEEKGRAVQLTIGGGEQFLNSDARSVARMHIEFDSLSYSVCSSKGKSKTVLKNVTGCFRPGRLTTIVGPSGAGKTTLLRVICSARTPDVNVNGSITINGDEWNGNAFRKQICLIPQEFALQPLLTAKETLYIAARLKTRDIHDERTVNFIVTEIAENLNLTSCLNTLVGNLSGGERKRLSIGVEITTKPSVLLIDEPTSGLDSASSNQVIGLLHKIAKGGCTVACAIHQPSSRMISQFDDLLVIHNGTSFYCGLWDDVFCTFSEAGYVCPQFYNISEFVLEVITGERSGDLNNFRKLSQDKYSKWREHYERPVAETDVTAAPRSDVTTKNSKSSIWQEQKILLLRAFICIKRDHMLTKLRLTAHVVIAFLLGIMFYDSGANADRIHSNIACVFFILMFLYFANAMPAVQMFPVEAAVFLREYLNNWYRLRSYFSIKVLSDLPLQILAPSVLITIMYYMTGQPMERDRFLRTWLLCVLTTIVGQSSGMLIGAAFNTQLGTFLIPALNMPMILFAGFFLKFSEVPLFLQPFCSISFFRFAFEGILQAFYDGDRERLRCYEIYCHLRSPKRVLEEMDMPAISYYTTVLGLCVWILLLQLSTYLVLKWKAQKAKQ
ncbi:ATP-binding cassette sub-family G member 4-like isoform X1 [Frieseomelitta varia]|uniref:ATP-binding cassette sub-family G member 4-like isoform X1 n=1 Tax=Frieseomelitta varia TaxID=561572 RepID=UPI001CB6B4A8|nr:ATP-binding cassette sub-family G member 4-like isoform X1 [Frieseomelitta varia]